MKRLLAIAATFFHLILGLTACSHEHTPSEWIVDKNATTTEDGAKHTVCTECGETLETATIPRLSCSVSSKVLTVNGDAIRGSFSYATEAFSFAADITVSDGATYAISTDIYGLNTFFTKTVPLEEGENVFYLHTLAPDETMHLYTVTLYRNHLYTVRFDTRGGTEIADQRVEEGKLATQKTTERAGYTFNQWDHDFSTPITKNTTVRASWKANTDTAYTVEHYLENADGTYPTSPTVVERLTATTDTNDVERMRDFPHFSYDPTRGTQENVYVLGDGSLVIHSYYKRNLYSVSISGSEYGAISNYSGYIHSEKYYKYGDSDSLTASAPSIGCEFLGWFSGETRLSTDATFSFTADKNVVAKFAPKSEMQNFLFTAGLYSCTITGIKDKTVTDIIVPSYVTRIEGGAFSGCAKLESLTVPTLENCLGYHFGIDDYGDAGDTYGWYDPVYPGVYCYLPTALESVTVLGGRLDFNAFIETKVKNITIGKDVEAIEICGSGAWDYFFGYSASFEGFTVHPENESFKAENGILFSKDGKNFSASLPERMIPPIQFRTALPQLAKEHLPDVKNSRASILQIP